MKLLQTIAVFFGLKIWELLCGIGKIFKWIGLGIYFIVTSPFKAIWISLKFIWKIPQFILNHPRETIAFTVAIIPFIAWYGLVFLAVRFVGFSIESVAFGLVVGTIIGVFAFIAAEEAVGFLTAWGKMAEWIADFLLDNWAKANYITGRWKKPKYPAPKEKVVKPKKKVIKPKKKVVKKTTRKKKK